MSQYLGFNEEFREEILKGEKAATLRYKDRELLPDEGDVIQAVISHDEGAFATLRVTDVTPMTVQEVVETDFDTHQNYESIEMFNERMKQYYDTEFTGDTVVYFISFELIDEEP